MKPDGPAWCVLVQTKKRSCYGQNCVFSNLSFDVTIPGMSVLPDRALR